MEPRVIKVVPTDEYFSFSWRITNRCNYDCMYCPTKWHDTTSKHYSLDELQKIWLNVYEKTKHKNLRYKIGFTGGEVTGNKDFLPFISWLRNNYNDKIFKMLVTTNGSANFKYYRSLFDYVDNISFSFHSEHANEKNFFDMIIKLKNEIDNSKFVHVNIMNESWNKDRIPMYVRLLQSNNISHEIDEIDYSMQTRTFPIFKGKLNYEI